VPTVLRIGSLRFVIWPNDHPPPHVHVFSSDAEAKIELGPANGFPRLIENRRMKRRQLVIALRAVYEHREALRDMWRTIHG
jgi:Domain of unknown function (DUF4160)